MSEIKLKPCPFCGGTDLHYYVDNFVRTYVECNTCGVKVQGAYNSKKGEKEADEFWNRRADTNDP